LKEQSFTFRILRFKRGRIDRFDSLVIDESKVSTGLGAFRLSASPRVIISGEAIKAAVDEADLQDVQLVPVAEFNSISHSAG